MKTMTFTVLFITIFTISAFAQPATLWTQHYGGYYEECGKSVQQTTDGGFIIVGYTWSYGAGSDDVYLVKTDAEGNEEWSQTYGGSEGDFGYCVQQTSDGGYIIAGETSSFGAGGGDVWLVKTDASGVEEWNATFGGTASDRGNFVQQTSDGGYIIVGYTYSYGLGSSDVYLIKTDASGVEEWSRTFGDTSGDHGTCIQQIADGGFIIVGGSYNILSYSMDVFLIRTDGSGYTDWIRTLGGDYQDEGYYVRQTDDGNFIIVGYTQSFGAGQEDVYLIKADDSGFSMWSQTFGGSEIDKGFGVQPTIDGGFILVGRTQSSGAGYDDVYLIKTDDSGEEEWSQTYGGTGWDFGYCVQQTDDNGFIITGSTDNDGAGEYDVCLIRLESETGVIDPNLTHPLTYSVLSVYPNPFNPSTVISFDLPVAGIVELQVFDLYGRLVSGEHLDSPMQAGHHSISFDGIGLPSGIYFARLTAGDFQQTQKLVLMK